MRSIEASCKLERAAIKHKNSEITTKNEAKKPKISFAEKILTKGAKKDPVKLKCAKKRQICSDSESSNSIEGSPPSTANRNSISESDFQQSPIYSRYNHSDSDFQPSPNEIINKIPFTETAVHSEFNAKPNDNSYLNEEENWKGKNRKEKTTKKQENLDSQRKNTKKRGRYLTPCIDIQLIHNRPLRRKKTALLRNGICLGPVWIGRRLVQLKNTCPFDTFVEILSTAYIDNDYYLQKLDILKDSFLTISLIKSYAINGPTTALYTERGNILATVFNETHNTIDCASNTSRLIESLLQDIPSSKNETQCLNCGIQIKLTTTIEVDAEKVIKFGFNSGFDRFITDFFLEKKVTCNHCKFQCSSQNVPGIHLIFDIEYALYRSFHQEFHQNAPETIYIRDIKNKITISNKNYILNGIIVYMPPALAGRIGHFVAYCRRVTGSWEIHNDMCKELTKVHNDNTKVKACNIIYTQIS